MCNAWNHSGRCGCGFGGYTWGGWGSTVTVSPVRSTWRYRDEDFCRPTSCPVCGADVFFVRHNGGSVWFDELGWPWPKHGCFDDEPPARRLRRALTSQSSRGRTDVFGVIVETVAINPGYSGRIAVRCSDATIIDAVFETNLNVAWLVGQLVRVRRGKRKLSLSPVGQWPVRPPEALAPAALPIVPLLPAPVPVLAPPPAPVPTLPEVVRNDGP